MHPTPPIEGLAEDPHFFALLTRSYARLVGSPLVAEGCGPAWLYHEAANRFERQRLLTAVEEQGFVTGYSGWRISRSGRRFRIQDGVIWQLMNAIGRVLHHLLESLRELRASLR